MASTILFVLLLRASLSVEQDLKTVNKSDATFDSSVNRNKREVVVSNYSCAEGMKWLSYRCVESELYNKLKEDDYDETSESQVENALSEPSPTTQLFKRGPTKRPRKKPWPRPKSPGPATTLRPRPTSSGLSTTPRPRPTSSGPPTTPTLPGPSTTSEPDSSLVSRAETTSLTMTTILFALCLSLLHCAVLLLPISQDVT